MRAGGAAGDLYIDIRIKADKQFTRDGDDLHCWIQVPMSWAVLGHDLSIDTFDGEKTVSIPAGCQTEDTVTLKGLGVTNIRNKDERGNLIAHVNALIPTKLNETERGLIEQFAASHDSGATHVSQAIPSTGRSKERFLQQVEGRTELRVGWKVAALPCGSRAERLFLFTGDSLVFTLGFPE